MRTRRMKTLALAALLAAALICLSACASSARDQYSAPNMIGGVEYAETEYDPSAAPGYDAAGGTAYSSLTENRKIVRSASFDVETAAFDAELSALRQRIGEAGGYFEGSDVSAYDGTHRMATLTARVPTAALDSVIEYMRAVNGVASERLSDEDVTDQYTDVELRISVLTESLERLKELQKESDDVETVIRLQQEINSVLLELDDLKGALRHLDGRVEYSTVHVTLREVLEPQLDAGERSLLGDMRGALVTSANAVLAFLRACLVLITALLPVLVLLAVILALVMVILRLCTGRWLFRRKKKDS